MLWEKSIFIAPKDLPAWEADMALEFSQCFHAMTFKCHYLKNRIKFLPVPFYILHSFSELLMKLSLNSSYYGVNDVRIFITKHCCGTNNCGLMGHLEWKLCLFVYSWRPPPRITNFLYTVQSKLFYLIVRFFCLPHSRKGIWRQSISPWEAAFMDRTMFLELVACHGWR